jgi:rod shape determining protein RodA
MINNKREKILLASSTLNKGENSLSKQLFTFSSIKKINKSALFVFLSIIVVGLVNLFSISTEHFVRQIIFCVLFIPVFLLIVSLNPRYFIKFSYLGIFASIILLISVFIFGDLSMGARRWIDIKVFKFQPSEFAKFLTVLFFARCYHFTKDSEMSTIKAAIIPVIFLAIQIILILKEPDLGTSFTLGMIGISLLFLAGLKMRYFLIGFVLGVSLIPIIWSNLHEYQKKRIRTFLNPESDLLGAGYNIQQAKIAIGSGGLNGKGIFFSTQSKLNFLPESHTDFAFTIFAEQFGFIGSLALLTLYAYLIYFGFYVSINSQSHFIRLASGGISCLIFLHIIINLAMTSGLIPVVGNPLPLISYGGTFLISNLICFAMLLNFDINKSMVIHSSRESYMEK